jgi:hypothetical protein
MIRHSRSTEPNSRIQSWTKQYLHKSNMPFFTDALAAFAKDGRGNGGQMVIGLVGSRDLPGVTLRRAQSILRWDMRPSLWSTAFLIAEPARQKIAATKLLGVSLHPRTGIFPRPERNGVSEGTLALYADRNLDANVALLAISMNADEVAKVSLKAGDPNLDRVRYNLWDTLGVWQAFLWSFGQRPNPLREGFPIASSSFVEYCFEAINLDLTPGASERNSAPEHIWNAAKWWQNAYSAQNREITGYYVLRDEGCSLQNAGEED